MMFQQINHRISGKKRSVHSVAGINDEKEIRPDPLKQKEVNNSQQKQPRIVIIEDELLVAENTKEILEASGYTVIAIYSSGEEAISNFERLDPDMIIMDIRLSGSADGIETALFIHRTFKKIPIVFLTAYRQDQFPHMSAVSPPLFSYLTKPCYPQELTKCIEKLFHQLEDHKGDT